jgi:cytidylate kinase
MTGSVLLVAGPPGAGKSTVCGVLAARSEQSVLIPTDDLYTWIAKGHVDPWLPASHHQNVTIFSVAAAAADRFAAGGYDVLVDGVLGMWGLDVWRALERPVSYALLLPTQTASRQRAIDRGEHALTDVDVVDMMHAAFVAHLDGYERHVIDSTDLDVDATVAEVARRHHAGELVLS